MYRVVIIDDEPIIVEGLTKGVEWDKWDCEVCGSASDGIAGMALINEKRPDILITDISMPQMDGLTMTAALRSSFPNMQITILTGFREFDYAKRAIELGVTRFLLKPSKFAEIEEAVTAMCGKLKKSARIAEEQEVLRNAGQEDEEKTPGRNTEEDPEEQTVSKAGSFIVNQALEYMRDHYAEKLRLQDVADRVFVSQWHLSKLLNRHTGKTFSELLNGIRIEKAKELLEEPGLRVSDVAENVGFVDLAHFSRVFKSVSGMSANEYRNRIG